MTPTTIPEQVPTRTAPLEPGTRERTPSDVLLAAARYIEEHGWVQGLWLDTDGAVCMDGAIAAVVTGHPHGITACVDEATQQLYYGAVRRLYRRFSTPVSYNDAHGRTKVEVLAALRDAAR